jgi:deazaflavin-dependent oxidoreductase (nitroreductase family)
MPIEGEHEPSPAQWIRDQVAEYERSGGQRANTLLDTGLPIVIVTARGNKSGKVRNTPLMRVEPDGVYTLVASKGGAERPVWYYNLKADPAAVTIQDGAEPVAVKVTEYPGRSDPSGGTRRWPPTRPAPSTRPRRNARFRSSWPADGSELEFEGLGLELELRGGPTSSAWRSARTAPAPG